MRILIHDTGEEAGREAARKGASLIRHAMNGKAKANIILATGASQFEMLKELITLRVDWSRVAAFHLDEYIGLSASHPASFRKYLKDRFVDHVQLGEFHGIDGQKDPDQECRRLGEIISAHPVDVAFIGIGENGHLAFNDPPADLETEEPYIRVNLDHACRTQQFNEGWFPSVKKVPETAISMSVRQILKSKAIICTVPDRRKAEAVKAAVEGRISPDCPASVLKNHREVYLFLDRESSSLIRRI
jgi:glucosamine-6-phosphate deaminase